MKKKKRKKEEENDTPDKIPMNLMQVAFLLYCSIEGLQFHRPLDLSLSQVLQMTLIYRQKIISNADINIPH